MASGLNIADLLQAARVWGWRIATAESCTGGMVAAALTDVAGSSDVFDRGFVTYSNAAKVEMLGVRPETLEAHGAVSEEVAREMARGAIELVGADLAVATTGVAGPDPQDGHDVGTVFVAVSGPSGSVVRRLALEGDRAAIREATVDAVLRLCRDQLRSQSA